LAQLERALGPDHYRTNVARRALADVKAKRGTG
jgi:hypothetical protein